MSPTGAPLYEAARYMRPLPFISMQNYVKFRFYMVPPLEIAHHVPETEPPTARVVTGLRCASNICVEELPDTKFTHNYA